MKRWICKNKSQYQDEFDKQWEEKFGSDEQSKHFHSLDEFHDWLEEVKKFEPVYNK